jgi:hypothetical protein
MKHTTHNGASTRSRACILVAAAAALVCLAVAPVALAAPLGIIDDPTATPSFEITVAGAGASVDMAMGVAADSSGAYVAGFRGNAAGNADASLVKVVGGAQKWVKMYDSPRHKDDWGYRVAKRGTAVYVAGWSKNSIGKMDILLVKWSSSGTFQWARRYDGPIHGDDAATALGIDKNGNVTVAGYSQGAGGDDWVVVSWSSSGVQRWKWRYAGSGGGADRPMDLVVDGSNRVYVTGWITVTGPKVKAMTVKFSPAGAKLWSKTTFGTGGLAAAANGIALRPAGGVYVVGNSRATLTGMDPLVMRYSSGGAPTFLPGYTVAGDQDLFDVAVTSNGRVAVVGSNKPGATTDALLGLYTSSGSLVGYASALAGPFNDAFVAVGADPFGGYLPVGYLSTAADHSQWEVFRLPSVPGLASWRSEIYGTSGIDVPGPAALLGVFGGAVAASGNKVYVVGERVTGGPSGVDQQIAVFMY